MRLHRWLAVLLWMAAAAHAGEFRFAILGDRTGSAVPGIYERIWREVDADRPAFVINVGDSIQGHSDPAAAGEWRELRRIWSRYRYPLFLVAGNHDIWNPSSRRLFEKAAGRPPSYSFDWDGAHFTVLDNSGGMTLTSDQLAFLEKDLIANRARRPKFVFFHQPFWLPYAALGSGAFPLHRLAKEYAVDYVVSGHVHQLIRMKLDGVTYLAVGSSGASISRGTDRGEGRAQGWFYQHVLATVNGASATLKVKELGGPWAPLDPQ